MKTRWVFYFLICLFLVPVLSHAATCWVGEQPAPYSTSTNSVSGNDGKNLKLYWLYFDGVASNLSMKVKLNPNSPETLQIHKLKNVNGLISIPFALPADAAVHGPAKLIAKYDGGKCTYDFDVVGTFREVLGGPSPVLDNTTVCYIPAVSGINSVGRVRVGIYLQHTYDSDLQIYIVSPNNITVMLSNRRGAVGDNFGAGGWENSFYTGYTVFDDSAPFSISTGVPPFQGYFQPDMPLSVLNGLTGNDVNGSWQICVSDVANGDTGFFLGGYLEITDSF